MIDVSNGLSTLVNKIEERSPQCHAEFQKDRHETRYIFDSVVEFLEWSLGRMENIISQR